MPKAVAVATTTPGHRFDQATLLRIAGYRDPLRAGFFRNIEIDGRHLSGQPVVGDWGLMVALGPGFAAEGALLRW